MRSTGWHQRIKNALSWPCGALMLLKFIYTSTLIPLTWIFFLGCTLSDTVQYGDKTDIMWGFNAHKFVMLLTIDNFSSTTIDGVISFDCISTCPAKDPEQCNVRLWYNFRNLIINAAITTAVFDNSFTTTVSLPGLPVSHGNWCVVECPGTYFIHGLWAHDSSLNILYSLSYYFVRFTKFELWIHTVFI